MKHCILSFLAVWLLAEGLSSQVSFNAHYISGQSDRLDMLGIAQDGVQGSVSMHLRLKNIRVEFHPGLGYRKTFDDASTDGDFGSIDLDVPVSVYPFDFAGDCDCPTFSKQGNLIKKGFFFEVVPGMGLQNLSLQSDPLIDTLWAFDEQQLVFKVGFGAGVDIGISEHLTLTPIIRYNMILPHTFDRLAEVHGDGEIADMRYLSPGLRLTYIADPKKRRRK